ncbi:hypothetical protein G4Y79_08840 [Phototrophicus methaneseepsis]|uniref:Uncharacterized protein n=1 Tax=Phototrophicus methaneseepsis TaxID=2710758 RepID=A0A7S8IF88_9CHLR|nr:hypothetical protein [Phototrophicus methaneseepsis]QPC84465.1 hypothetical protein G4Y79_08840 [Phototrophicus methaneseepsis]
MLNITYAPSQAETAQQLKTDLAAARRLQSLHKDTLIVLVTTEALADKDLLAQVKKADRPNTVIIPLLLEPGLELPSALNNGNALDLTGQNLSNRETVNRLVSHILHSAIGEKTRSRNRLIFGIVGIAVLAVFWWAISGISAGTVGFPVDEYNTEEAANLQMISTFVFPTLDGLRPRTTEEALHFPETVEAASTRDRIFLAGTATQMPIDRQTTAEAIDAAITGTVSAQTATAPATATPAATETPAETENSGS